MSQRPSDFGQFQLVMEILANALELPAADRGRYLDEACGDQVALRAEVESLLASASAPIVIDRPLADFSLVGDVTNSSPAPETSLQPGQALAHYLIEKKLGEGGVGAVYKASDLKLGRTVALKVLRFTQASWQDRHRFALEARAASALNHPNIVTIYELGIEGDIDFISMEFVDGQTLSSLLGHPETPRSTLLQYARQAADGIAAAHAAGLVHRDLKPGNIMVTRHGKVKVLDFGLARRPPVPQAEGVSPSDTVSLTDLSLSPGVVTGTPAYMSPEQAVGAALDFRSDIFSFGVILYELVTGQRPFRGVSPQEILHQVTVFDPISPATLDPTVPSKLAGLIENCLQKDKEKRPASMAEVVQILERLEATPEPLAVPAASRRTLFVTLAGGAAALGGGWWYLSRSAAPSRVTLSLQAQQMAGGQPLGEPYLASPQDLFKAGWRFRLRAQSEAPGFLHVVNDGPGDNGKLRLWVLFSGQVDKKTKPMVETGWYVFDSTPGTERLWVIWSSGPLPDLVTGEVKDLGREASIRRILAQKVVALTAGGTGALVLQGEAGIRATRMDLQHIL